MAKTILGIDIGYDSLKLALVTGNRVKKTAVVPMPQKLVKEGRAVSPETMGELIRTTMKEHGIRCRSAALALPNETVFVRSVTMPRMSVDQLTYNLPFEFRDYITDEMKNYLFDYAMVSAPEQKTEGEGGSMELLAVAAPVSLIDESKALLRKAGLKLTKAAPALCSYISLIRRLGTGGQTPREFCILDLGYRSIRMYMFRGDKHVVTRVLEIGMSSLDDVLAEAYNVDVHLAHTYLLTNYDDCQNKDVCLNAYNNVAVELMRALNFYRFSNQESELNDVWLCGGGAVIPAMQTAIASALDMRIHQAAELVAGGRSVPACHQLIQAIGIAQD